MGEIKISISEDTEKIIQKICDDLGIKKTEYVKSLVIESLKSIHFDKNREKDGKK